MGLKDVYGVEFKEFKSLDSSGPLVKGALNSTVRKALAALGDVLTTEDLTELNRQVDKDKKDPEDVADAYAKRHGLVK